MDHQVTKKLRWFGNRFRRLERRQDHRAIVDLWPIYRSYCEEHGWPSDWPRHNRIVDLVRRSARVLGEEVV